jgi:hypothetical protein
MDGFFQQVSTGDTVKDYAHASQLFVGDNFRLAPKMGYLFHVYLDLDSTLQKTTNIHQIEAGMLVKSVDLPKFTVDAKTLNSYNKPNIVQNKIKYEPVTITFHDDSADVVRSLWADYYTYYYRDMDAGTQRGAPSNVYSQNNKYDSSRTANYGFSARTNSSGPTNQFLRAIRIYSLHQKKFTEYILVNPIITSFKHGQHAAGQSEPMQCEMTVSYEFVLYCDGHVSSNTVNGFAGLHYDNSPSPLTPANGTKSILGPGGMIDTADDVINDAANGAYGAAAFTALRGLQNASSLNLKQAVSNELTQFGMDILRGNNPLNRIAIPTIGDHQSVIAATQNASVDAVPNFSLSSAVSNGASIAANYLPASIGTALAVGKAASSLLGSKISNSTASATAASAQQSSTPPAP